MPDDNSLDREEIQKLAELRSESLASIINAIFNPSVLTEALVAWAQIQAVAATVKTGQPVPAGFSIPVGGGKSLRFQGTASLE